MAPGGVPGPGIFDFRRLALTEMRKCRRDTMVRLATELVPVARPEQFRVWGKPGIRAQLLDTRTNTLEMDFCLQGDTTSFNVLNISSAFTCALPFSDHVVNEIVVRLGSRPAHAATAPALPGAENLSGVRRYTGACAAACAWLALVPALSAQTSARSDSLRATVAVPVEINSKDEERLRYLQTLGHVSRHPWSLRGFSLREARVLAGDSVSSTGVNARAMPASVRAWYNSAYPYGMNDGPVWVGRGFTTSVTAGVVLEWGPIELILAPTAFWTENREFPLMRVPDTVSAYSDPLTVFGVDRPQRFGDRPYARLDPGSSTFRVQAFGVQAGVSTANEWWGPMSDYPFVLGNNAPGFLHLFAGTARPVSVGVGRLHTRLIYGELAQTSYSPVPADSGRRFAGGMIAVIEPRGFPGLEVGFTRFFHMEWPDSLSNRHFAHLFETLLKSKIGRVLNQEPTDPGKSSRDNQLASVFARWVLGRSGFELYGEYSREDHSVDVYDLLVEPDHSSLYGWGLRRAWRTPGSLRAMRVETINYQPSSLGRHRPQSGAYGHSFTRQGHTHMGQLLGSGIGAGAGAGAIAAFSEHSPSGALEVSLARMVVRDTENQPTDVQYAARVERTHLRSPRLELVYAADVVVELNRYFGADQGNLRLEAGMRWRP